MLFRNVKKHNAPPSEKKHTQEKGWDECKIVASEEQEVGESLDGGGRGLLLFRINLIKWFESWFAGADPGTGFVGMKEVLEGKQWDKGQTWGREARPRFPPLQADLPAASPVPLAKATTHQPTGGGPCSPGEGPRDSAGCWRPEGWW